MVNWRLLCFVYEVAMSSISVILNALVIYLCIHKLSDSIRLYRRFFIFGAIIDSIFALVTAITQMMLVDHDTKMIFVLESPFLPATSLCARISTAVLVFCSHMMIWSVCVQFVNRMNIFCWQNYYSIRQIVGFSALYLMWLIAHGFLIFYAYNIHDDPKTTRELSQNALFKNRTIGAYAAGDTHNGRLIVLLIEVQFLLCSYYSVIFYCGYKIRQKLREDRDILQARTIRTQTRLSYILTTQAVIPLITVVCPIGSMCVLPLISISFDNLAIFTKLTVNFMPIANPLVIMITIPRFRKFILSMASKRFSSTVRPSVVSETSGNRNQQTNSF
ncbi:hypothetical protein M3Y94_01276100 [Aphelenchoides besseyi]|nr:hypothetical protein M3Y94_01276100 [Aphelenchoides besseyi]